MSASRGKKKANERRVSRAKSATKDNRTDHLA